MKRIIAKLAIFLLLGMIINIVVAWGSACLSTFPQIGLYTTPKSNWANIDPLSAEARWLDERGWQITRSEVPPKDEYLRSSFKYVRYEIRTFSRFAFGLERIEYIELITDLQFHDNMSGTIVLPFDSPLVARISAGWPLHALYGEQSSKESRYGQTTRQYSTAIPLQRFGKARTRDAVLPYRPIWYGFAINTIFYATLLWLLTLGPFEFRRIIRRKRGLCIKCGYDLRGTEHHACPECGWGRETEA